MAKRFKLKFSRVIPSFQLCRSKKQSKLPEAPVPFIHRLSPVNPKALDISYPNLNFPAPPPSTPADYFFIEHRHLSPEIASVSCGCRARSCSNQRETYEASFSNEIYGDIPSILMTKHKVNRKEKKMEKVKAIASVPSRDSGCFSSQIGAENEETETLISTSRTFSDDSSFESDQSLTEHSHNEIKRTKKMKRPKSFGSKKYRGTSSKTSKARAPPTENGTTIIPPREAEGKVRESVAVVKKSEDPYEDFKRSMLEMILEKQMFETNDLEQLLQCFLSLNSRQYHGIIVEAFTEIWGALFSDYPMNVL